MKDLVHEIENSPEINENIIHEFHEFHELKIQRR